MTAVLPIILPPTAPMVHGGYAPSQSGQGGGAIGTMAILRDSRIMRDNLRMADNG